MRKIHLFDSNSPINLEAKKLKKSQFVEPSSGDCEKQTH